jgi:hypothetical protein
MENNVNHIIMISSGQLEIKYGAYIPQTFNQLVFAL